MTTEEFFELFARSAWRLETLDYYAGTSDAAVRAFQEGRPLPLEERPAKQQMMRLVAAARDAGSVAVKAESLAPAFQRRSVPDTLPGAASQHVPLAALAMRVICSAGIGIEAANGASTPPARSKRNSRGSPPAVSTIQMLERYWSLSSESMVRTNATRCPSGEICGSLTKRM